MGDLSDKVASQDVFEGYGGTNESLYSYSALMGVFGLIFALFLLLSRLTGRPIPERIGAGDIALLGMAAHKMSMVGFPGRHHEPPARPGNRDSGEGEPQKRGREAKGRGP